MSEGRPVHVIATGVHGSASTWVFNVAREVMTEAYGPDAVHPCHLASMPKPGSAWLPEGRHAVIKTHGWPGLPAFAGQLQAAGVVSVRDPRDAILSLMQRFGETFQRAMQGVTQDWRSALECRRLGFPVLVYETRFFEIPRTVHWLARHIGVTVSDTAAARIFHTYSTGAVRQFAAAVADQPPETRDGSGDFWFDRVTQITNRHIGDGQTGKWRTGLAEAERLAATQYFQPVLEAFGYDTGVP